MSSSEDGNIKSLKCEFCPLAFSKIDDLANHLVNGHANKTINNIEANDSTKKILIEMNIKDGKNQDQTVDETESATKNRTCHLCDKEFSQVEYLKTHINTVHNGQKDYKCDSCGKSFSQSGNLKNHF